MLTRAGKSSSGRGYFGTEFAVLLKPGGSLSLPPFSGGLRSPSPFTTVLDLSLRMEVAGGVGVRSVSVAFSLKEETEALSSGILKLEVVLCFSEPTRFFLLSLKLVCGLEVNSLEISIMVGALRNSCAVTPEPSSSSSERDKAFFGLTNAPLPMLDVAAFFEALAVDVRVGAVGFVVLVEEEAAHAEPTEESGFPGLLLDTKAGKSSSWKALEDLVVVV